jgi:hypothetical protein
MKKIVISIAAVVLTACGGKAFQYRSQNEIPAGPGLLTGEEGAFVLHRSPSAQATASTAAKDQAPPAAAGETQTSDREFEAYREYRRAKDQRSAEYLEFREWIEWKAYLRRKGDRDAGTN